MNYLNKIFSSIENLKFEKEEKCIEFNIIMKIMNTVYSYIDENPELIDRFNYSVYINKYRIFTNSFSPQNYNAIKTFINNYNKNIIKNKLIIELTCLIYLCYKTNKELGEIYKPAQYMLLDYFWGITINKNVCVPINKKQILLKILDITDTESSETNDPLEITFFNTIKKIQNFGQQIYSFPTRYSDCGEKMLLNLFNNLLLKEDGSFNLEKIGEWDEKLRNFYLEYNTIKKWK